jgi:hypothetical protein
MVERKRKKRKKEKGIRKMHLSASCLPTCHRHTPVGTAEPFWDMKNPSGYSLFPYS